MKSNNKEQREAREKMIGAYITEGSKGRIQWETVRAELTAGLDQLRAAFLEAVAKYQSSYEEDLQKAVDVLADLGRDLNGVERMIETARGSTPSAAEADPQNRQRQETEIHVLEAKAAEIRERLEALQEYKPAGDPELFEAAVNAEGCWREAKATADMITSGIRANIRKLIRDLEKQEQEVRRGIWSSVEIPEECRLSELKRLGRGSFTVSELLQKREAAEEKQAAIRETVERTKAALQASQVTTSEENRRQDNEQQEEATALR